MRLSFAAAVAALALLLCPMGTPPARAANLAPVGKRAAHKHYRLYVAKKHKHFHLVHTYPNAKAAHRAAHKYHRKGYRTKIRAA
ncbi:hypothetical protein [Frigoriglobus tundricola]|uniref:SPOR domain-containing protein n=1 Tax=Frigoriglobus tundricola TaxID=2774151 RepID=A0A6M5Z0H5_9BACT|nr:hypothetical protein [Frigoriglobus tundricola]QJW99130.1 hypothetical protein FTUN_6730 [Frigoriglobus tundricola]